MKPENVRHVKDEVEGSDREHSLYSLPEPKGSPSYQVTLEMSGQPISMEIDTGASLSLISESTYKSRWPTKRLLPTMAKLRTYSGETLPVLGTMQVQVCHNHQLVDLSLVVVRGDGPSLLGRDWLSQGGQPHPPRCSNCIIGEVQ